MRFEVNINKKHFIVILVLLLITGLGIAQTTPNPGHSINEVPGAAKNCLTLPTYPHCINAIAAGLNPEQVSVGSGYSAYSASSGDTGTLDGIDSTAFCKTNGVDCQVTLGTPVTGSIVGGGNDADGFGIFSCSSWSGATCSGGVSGFIACPSGSTKRVTGFLIDVTGSTVNVYICVRN